MKRNALASTLHSVKVLAVYLSETSRYIVELIVAEQNIWYRVHDWLRFALKITPIVVQLTSTSTLAKKTQIMDNNFTLCILGALAFLVSSSHAVLEGESNLYFSQFFPMDTKCSFSFKMQPKIVPKCFFNKCALICSLIMYNFFTLFIFVYIIIATFSNKNWRSHFILELTKNLFTDCIF